MKSQLEISSPLLINEKDRLECLLEEARINGYIQGMTDSLEQNQQAITSVLYACIMPFVKAYQIILNKKMNIKADIRAQFDPNSHTIGIVSIMEESVYLEKFEEIYLWERTFEDILFKQYPNLRGFCIDISVLPYSDKSPLDRNLVTNDFPYVAE